MMMMVSLTKEEIANRNLKESNRWYKKGLCIVCGEYRPVNRVFTCGFGCEMTKLKNPDLFPEPDITNK